MKRLLVFLFLLSVVFPTLAQNADSIAYEAQRNKINNMLEQRRKRFGEYDESLSQHTGIFGLQTKKDIRHSNEILMDIVTTDNEIFRQTKILLDYRVFQQEQAQSRVKDVESASVGFMNSINRLRSQLETAKNDTAHAQKEAEEKSKLVNILFVIIGLMAVSIFAVIRRNRIFKA